MVSEIVKKLREIDVHPVVVTPVSGPNRHERRKLDAQARQYRHLAKPAPRDWASRRRKARKQTSASRRANRAA